MSISLQHVDACLPITSLQELNFDTAKLLLQGQGPYSSLIDSADGTVLAKLRTFKRSNVHGFIPIGDLLPRDDGTEEVEILVWGGPSLRVVSCFYRKYEDAPIETRLSATTREYAAPDWVLDACISHRQDEENRAYLITAHNALLSLNFTRIASSKYQKCIRLMHLAAGVKSILYSADIIALTAAHVLIAAGTVFGEVVVWSCFLGSRGNSFPDAYTSIHHVFTGHEGSIFGVIISAEIPGLCDGRTGRLLASCSDDRTIRIWDISDCSWASPKEPSSYSTDGFELRSTGFRNSSKDSQALGSEAYLTKVWGHDARIWGVNFLYIPFVSKPQLVLVSWSEDATCQLWRLGWKHQPHYRSSFEIHNLSTLHSHTGKHIWSLAISNITLPAVIYTGGADGALRASQLAYPNSARGDGWLSRSCEPVESTCDRIQISQCCLDPVVRGGSVQIRAGRALKAFAFVERDCFVASSATGMVTLGWVQHQFPPGSNERPSVTWECLSVADDLGSVSTISSLANKGLAIIGTTISVIRLYNHATKHLSILTKTRAIPLRLYMLDYENPNGNSLSNKFAFVATYYELPDFADLFYVEVQKDGTSCAETFSLALPSTFQVSCASLVCGNRCLVLGSKFGALAVYEVARNNKHLKRLVVMRGVHGENSVTFISRIAPPAIQGGVTTDHLLTCGRDGNYCVHLLECVGDVNVSVNLRTVHRSAPSFAQHIEGAFFDETNQDLVLYGFRGKEFILWNESTRTEILSFDCGGAHRHWAYYPSTAMPGAGLYLWNQASFFNALYLRAVSYSVLCAGGHGREIKDISATNVKGRSTNMLFATGSEDTTVRIFAPTTPSIGSPWRTFKCLRVLDKHRAGLQQVRWSQDGNFMFTSAGFEEFFVWRICLVPVLGVATLHEASSPKEEVMSDLRITSFDVLTVDGPAGIDCFLFCLAYSNSTIKIFHYDSSPSKANFTLLGGGTYTTNCITQIRFLVLNSSIDLVTCATDGYFTIWGLGAILNSHFLVTLGRIRLQPTFETKTIIPDTVSWRNRYRIHLNGVKSIEMVKISQDTTLIMSGGDDNALSVSLLKGIPNEKTDAVMSTISIPDAHASAITTVKLLRRQELVNSRAKTLLASSGSDHRIRVWSIGIDLEKEGTRSVEILECINRYSPVADILCMDVLHYPQGENMVDDDTSKIGLLICGVGMELLEVNLN